MAGSREHKELDGITITAHVGEGVFLSLRAGERLTGSFWMHTYRRQPVGCPTIEGFVLADEKRHCYRQCGGVFSPCVYLAVGPLIHFAPARIADGTDAEIPYDMVMDCGFPLDVTPLEMSRRVGPFVRSASDPWMAGLGEVHFRRSARPRAAVECVAVSAAVLDIRPSSATFATITPWGVGDKLPHDPDTLQIPSVFVTFALLHAEGAKTPHATSQTDGQPPGRDPGWPDGAESN